MQIIIDIPEEEYKCVQITGCIGNKTCIANAIYNGTPLPKGHGRLINADELLKAMDTWDKFGYLPHDLIPLHSENGLNLIPYVHYNDMVTCVTNMPTIIKADKEDEQ